MKQATARAAANWRRVYAMLVASVYPSYIVKAEKKGRNRAEVDEIFQSCRARREQPIPLWKPMPQVVPVGRQLVAPSSSR
jgi:hypothetical protein